MRKKEFKSVTAHLDKNTHDHIKCLAESAGMTMSEYTKRALESYEKSDEFKNFFFHRPFAELS